MSEAFFKSNKENHRQTSPPLAAQTESRSGTSLACSCSNAGRLSFQDVGVDLQRKSGPPFSVEIHKPWQAYQPGPGNNRVWLKSYRQVWGPSPIARSASAKAGLAPLLTPGLRRATID